MSDDYFSDEAIKARIDQRMRRFQLLFGHVVLGFGTVFAAIVLAAMEVITDPLVAVVLVIAMIFSIILHGVGFGLAMIREGLTKTEMQAAQDASEKAKHESMYLSDDGELLPEEVFYDDTDAHEHSTSTR